MPIVALGSAIPAKPGKTGSCGCTGKEADNTGAGAVVCPETAICGRGAAAARASRSVVVVTS